MGHQAIGQAFGESIKKALFPAHGKARIITYHQQGILKGLPSPLTVGRYHSLIVSDENFPAELMVTSYSEEREIMSLQRRTHKIYGVQFHPESVLIEHGYQLLQNFLNTANNNLNAKAIECDSGD